MATPGCKSRAVASKHYGDIPLHETVKLVVYPSPVVLPHNATKRFPPRPKSQRQDNYDELFDANTLFYDSVRLDGGISFIGPPLLNLETVLSQSVFSGSNGKPLRMVHNSLDRTAITRLDGDEDTDVVNIHSSEMSLSAVASPNLRDLFEGTNALVTKSKDNRLTWISDWVKFHVAEQKIDAVLIYDNNSSQYGPEDVLEAISVPGIKVAVVVHWPFKFGPQGGSWNGLKGAPWDSDFCEYGIMEHARQRFLGRAGGVLNVDIDELVITKGDDTVFDILADLDCGAISFTGRWIETAGRHGTSESFADYSYYDKRRAPTTIKWAISPTKIPEATQWKTHMIAGVKMVPSPTTMHRHFMGISSNWKWQRSTDRDLAGHHERDQELLTAFGRAFPIKI